MSKVILVDLDGTIADCSHRLHHIEKDPKDWESFFAKCGEDKPIESTIELLENTVLHERNLYIDNDLAISVVFLTGRPERILTKTVKWIMGHTPFIIGKRCHLLVRPDGDHRPAEVVKLEQVAKAGIKPEDILCVFDDDEKVCQAWKELGVTVYKVM